MAEIKNQILKLSKDERPEWWQSGQCVQYKKISVGLLVRAIPFKLRAPTIHDNLTIPIKSMCAGDGNYNALEHSKGVLLLELVKESASVHTDFEDATDEEPAQGKPRIYNIEIDPTDPKFDSNAIQIARLKIIHNNINGRPIKNYQATLSALGDMVGWADSRKKTIDSLPAPDGTDLYAKLEQIVNDPQSKTTDQMRAITELLKRKPKTETVERPRATIVLPD